MPYKVPNLFYFFQLQHIFRSCSNFSVAYSCCLIMQDAIHIIFCLTALMTYTECISRPSINLKTQTINNSILELDISNQSRQTIEQDEFKNTPNLYVLNMSRNNLSVIRRGIFNGLKNLIHLDMSNNSIEIIESTSFIGFHLTVLELQSNKLDNVSSIVESCDSLQLLNMSWNALKVLDSFSSCAELQTLLLSDNKIRILTKGTFPKSLVHLDLAYNKFESIDVEAFEGLDRLKVLDLEYNGLFKLEGGTVPVGLFVPLKSIERLDLSHNDLSKFFIGTFTHLASLSRLDLGYNNLTNLPAALLINLPVKSLSIEGNELTNLDTTFLQPIYNISIQMEDNSWNCDDLSSTIHKIMTVNTNNIVLRGNCTNSPNIQGIKCDENVDTPKPNDLTGLVDVQDVLHNVRQIKSILEMSRKRDVCLQNQFDKAMENFVRNMTTIQPKHGLSVGLSLVLIVMLIIIIIVAGFAVVYLFYRYSTRQPETVIDDRLLDNF